MMRKNIKKFPVIALMTAIMLFQALLPVFPQESAGNAMEILRKVDENEVYNTISYDAEMIIEYRGKRFIKTFTGQARENRDSFIEFTNSEDRGTKYLKKDGRLYVYSPDTEQVLLISGHLLKESMMGSDLSYEDTIENEKLSSRYSAKIVSEEKAGERDAWVLELTALRKTESYPKRRLVVAKDNYDLLSYELYALSGAKLKEYSLIRSEKIGKRSFPVESQMRDLLRRGSRTVFVFRNLVLDSPVPDSVFSMRNLEK